MHTWHYNKTGRLYLSTPAVEKAIEHPKGLLEVRYVIRPLKDVKIDNDDPHGSAPKPDHLFPLLFESVADRISGDGYRSKREYPASEAKRLFNAEWAAATAFDVHPQFSSQYKQGILVAMHRSKQADAYVIFLYNDYPKIKTLLDKMQTSLRFKP